MPKVYLIQIIIIARLRSIFFPSSFSRHFMDYGFIKILDNKHIESYNQIWFIA